MFTWEFCTFYLSGPRAWICQNSTRSMCPGPPRSPEILWSPWSAYERRSGRSWSLWSLTIAWIPPRIASSPMPFAATVFRQTLIDRDSLPRLFSRHLLQSGLRQGPTPLGPCRFCLPSCAARTALLCSVSVLPGRVTDTSIVRKTIENFRKSKSMNPLEIRLSPASLRCHEIQWYDQPFPRPRHVHLSSPLVEALPS